MWWKVNRVLLTAHGEIYLTAGRKTVERNQIESTGKRVESKQHETVSTFVGKFGAKYKPREHHFQ